MEGDGEEALRAPESSLQPRTDDALPCPVLSSLSLTPQAARGSVAPQFGHISLRC